MSLSAVMLTGLAVPAMAAEGNVTKITNDKGRTIQFADTGITELMTATAPVTREQLVTFICRYTDWKGLELPSKTVDLSQYQDADEISGWAMDFVVRTLEAGIINGKSEDTLAPQGTATRAQIAQIFMNLLAE